MRAARGRCRAIDGLDGVTVIDCNTATVTVSTSMGEVIPLRLAVMLLVLAAAGSLLGGKLQASLLCFGLVGVYALQRP